MAFPENSDEIEPLFIKVRSAIKASGLYYDPSYGSAETVIIQERIPYQEYGLDVVNNLKGEYQGSLIRRKIAMRSGETDKAETVIDSRISDIGQAIGKLLKHIGNLDCDLFINEDDIYLLEMNPRFGGGYPFMHSAGANLPSALVHWLRNNGTPDSALKYEDNIISAKVNKIVRLGDSYS